MAKKKATAKKSAKAKAPKAKAAAHTHKAPVALKAVNKPRTKSEIMTALADHWLN